MDLQHQPLQDMLGAYALGALDEGEREQVEEHLAGCETCQVLLSDYEAVMGALPYALPAIAPAPAAKTRLMAAARASKQAQRVEPPPATTPIGSVLPFKGRWRWLGVATVLLLLLGWNITLQLQLGRFEASAASVDVEQLATVPQGEVIPLVGSGQAGASARLYLAANQADGVLAIVGLPELPRDRVYQLWFAQPDNPTRTGGAFRVNSQGEALVAVTIPYPLDVVSAIAVTEEAAPRVERPTTPHLLDGKP